MSVLLSDRYPVNGKDGTLSARAYFRLTVTRRYLFYGGFIHHLIQESSMGVGWCDTDTTRYLTYCPQIQYLRQ